jgi:hypothetical protein
MSYRIFNFDTLYKVVDMVVFKRLRRCVLSFSFLFFLSVFSLPAFSQSDSFIQYGLEFEFASEVFIQPDPSKISHQSYEKLLSYVKNAFEDAEGETEILLWEKRSSQKPIYARYEDPDGRYWKVTPESVNTTGLDGFEFVTPPLKSLDDEKKVREIYEQILNNHEYGPGVRSSVHATFDVSHLISEDGQDASKLIHTILFIENHWPEIYAILSPIRYGTIINTFAVPLAMDQRVLLRKLAELPPENQSYEDLKQLFSEYHERELRLKKGQSNKAWKYRSANYGKLFGLGGDTPLNVLEFRLLDLDEPEVLFKKIEFLKRLIERAPNLGEGMNFKNPFRGVSLKSGLVRVNQFLYEKNKDDYTQFIKDLDLNLEHYPRFEKLNGPTLYGQTTFELKKMMEKLNFDEEIFYDSSPITFGFEVEMWGENVREVLTENFESIHEGKFAFLDGNVIQEYTGNYEVMSFPNTRLDETLRQMREMESVLKNNVVGFHIHLRLPYKITQDISPDTLNGWISRLEDVVFAWRTQHRGHYLALRSESLQRRPPHLLYEKGTLMVRKIDDSLDIEIRGFMDDLNELERFTKKLLLGLKFPEYLRGFQDEQTLLHFKRSSLIDMMQSFVVQYERRDLTPEEIDILRDVDSYATRNSVLPLFEFEHAPYLTDLERVSIRNATFRFKKRVRRLLDNVLVHHQYERQSNELYKQFRWRIKKWAQDIHLHDLLDRTILIPPSKEITSHQDEFWMKKLMQASVAPNVSTEMTDSAKRLMENLPEEKVFEIIKKALKNSYDPEMKRIAISILADSALDKTKGKEKQMSAAKLLWEQIMSQLDQTPLIPFDCSSLLSKAQSM